MRRVVSGKWVLPPSMRMSPVSRSGATSSMMSSTGLPGLDHHHDLARPLERRDELLRRVRADELLPLPAAVDELVHLGGGAVEDGDGVAAGLHVEDEVLAHDGEADQADVGGGGGHGSNALEARRIARGILEMRDRCGRASLPATVPASSSASSACEPRPGRSGAAAFRSSASVPGNARTQRTGEGECLAPVARAVAAALRQQVDDQLLRRPTATLPARAAPRRWTCDRVHCG